MNRRDLIKGIGAAICAGAVPPFLPGLLSSKLTLAKDWSFATIEDAALVPCYAHPSPAEIEAKIAACARAFEVQALLDAGLITPDQVASILEAPVIGRAN